MARDPHSYRAAKRNTMREGKRLDRWRGLSTLQHAKSGFVVRASETAARQALGVDKDVRSAAMEPIEARKRDFHQAKHALAARKAKLQASKA